MTIYLSFIIVNELVELQSIKYFISTKKYQTSNIYLPASDKYLLK